MWDWSKNQIEIIFLRHGAAPISWEHRYIFEQEWDLQAAGIAEKRHLFKDGYSVLQSDEALHRNRRNPLSKPYANIHTGVERNGFWRI